MTPESAAPVVVHDLAAVEAELARLWQANARSGEIGGGQAVLRAATFNLVVIVASERDGGEAAAVLTGLIAEHPGRVLIVCADPAAGAPDLRARVTAHCRRLVGGGPQVCGEQVVICAAGDAVDRVGGAMAGLLNPDCPAFAWWRGGPSPAASLLDRLAPDLDAWLLDGRHFDPATLPAWASRFEGRGRTLPVTDLAWEGIGPWREWTADCFEPADFRRDLRALARVRVEHGGDGEMAALLYVAWLAARLGWEAAPGLTRRDGGGWEGRLARAGGFVAVTLHPVAGGSLAAVALESEGREPLQCRLARPGAHGVTVEVSRGPRALQGRLIHAREPDEVTLVGDWLTDQRRDPIYGDALATLTAITRR